MRAPQPDKIKVGYKLTKGLVKRLKHEAVEADRDQSDIVEVAVDLYLKQLRKGRAETAAASA